MSSLIRTAHGRFSVTEAHTLQEIRSAAEKGRNDLLVLPTDRMFSAYPAFRTDQEADRFLLNGNRIPVSLTDIAGEPENGALYRVYLSDGRFTALYRYAADARAFAAEKMFLPGNS